MTTLYLMTHRQQMTAPSTRRESTKRICSETTTYDVSRVITKKQLPRVQALEIYNLHAYEYCFLDTDRIYRAIVFKLHSSIPGMTGHINLLPIPQIYARYGTVRDGISATTRTVPYLWQLVVRYCCAKCQQQQQAITNVVVRYGPYGTLLSYCLSHLLFKCKFFPGSLA